MSIFDQKSPLKSPAELNKTGESLMPETAEIVSESEKRIE